MQSRSQASLNIEGTASTFDVESTHSTHNLDGVQYMKSHFDISNKIGEPTLTNIQDELEYINAIGKSFVAAIDRFHVHRALLTALQSLYSFSACCILLKNERETFDLFVIPCQPLSASFIEDMFQRIVKAAIVVDFPGTSVEQLKKVAYFDAPDEVAQYRTQEAIACTEIGSHWSLPLTVENRIIGILSLFDEVIGTFDADPSMLRITAMIADYAAVALDNARLRERENALWRSAELGRKRLELILRSMAECLFITNSDGAIVSLNPSAQQLFAREGIELKLNVPLRDQDVVHKHGWLLRLADIIIQAQAGESVLNQELIINEHGETVPLTLSVSASPLHEQDTANVEPIEAVGVVVVLNDVTSSKQLNRLKDEFVSVVSHELRTPLTTIKGYTQHLVRRIERRLHKALSGHDNQQAAQSPTVESPERADLRSLHIVQSQTDHLERLVNELLDLSHVQEGQLTLKYSTFSLADVLADCVHSVQVSTEQHTLSFQCLVEDTEETPITADRERIAQVIGNLLDNAIKYSPQGGQIVVSLEMRQGNYYIQIIDQGIGVSTEHYDHIFERFYRIRSATSHFSGIGLGLYVAKAIIERHGGEIGFFNNANIGTTFHFTLPLRPRTQPLS